MSMYAQHSIGFFLMLSDRKKEVESGVKRTWGVGLKRSKKNCRNDSNDKNCIVAITFRELSDQVGGDSLLG
jgi:hypothetical protein